MLHPDVIQLDQAFVRGIDTDRDRRAVARAVVAFATEIDASVVAEGVETAEGLVALRPIGAAPGQGYLLGRPAPVAAIASAVSSPVTSPAASG